MGQFGGNYWIKLHYSFTKLFVQSCSAFSNRDGQTKKLNKNFHIASPEGTQTIEPIIV